MIHRMRLINSQAWVLVLDVRALVSVSMIEYDVSSDRHHPDNEDVDVASA